MPNRHRRKIRNYLINPRVQLKITLVMVLLTSLMTAVLGLFWYMEVRAASGLIRVHALATMGTEGAARLSEELAQADLRRLFVLIGFGIGLALLIAVYGIVMTHRIVGPLFKISRHMNDVEAGRLYKLWGLRKGDELQQFFADFERMHGALRERVEDDMMLLNQVIATVEAGRDVMPLVPKLREAVVQKGDSLRNAGDVTQKIQRDDVTGG